MNAPINMFASTPGGAGIVDHDFVAGLGPQLLTKDDAVERFGKIFHRALRDGDLPKPAGTLKGRSDATCAADAAEVFWTNELEQMLSSIIRSPKTTSIMTGPDAVLPIKSTLRPGQTDLIYDIETPTGQASFVEPDGMRRLTQVGEFSERKRHTATWSGVGYGWGLIESWQAAERGQRLEQSRPITARDTLARFNERVLLYGDSGNGLNGMLQQSQSMSFLLGPGFETLITDPDSVLVRLQTMDHYFSRIASTYGGSITGVLAPKRDMYALQRVRYDGGAGEFAMPHFMKMIPWLNQTRFIDGLGTAASTGGPLWNLWSDDPNEMWSELDPVPMVFGPFTDNNLRTSFVLITHIGGVILRRRERQARAEFDA